jgi:hypothetical protein
LQTLSDFLSRKYEVNMKYVKLGYHYLITHAMVLMLIPVFIITLAETLTGATFSTSGRIFASTS